MPGKDSYGPAGKWVHDRAHRIMEDNPETPKSVAYAVAVQQAHKVGKSPKDFRTPHGVHEAKMKYDEPKSEYQKTAMYDAFFDELAEIEKDAFGLKTLALAGGLAAAGAGGAKALPRMMTTAPTAITSVAKKVPLGSLHKTMGSGQLQQINQELGRSLVP